MIFIHTVSIVMALAVPLMYCVNMLQDMMCTVELATVRGRPVAVC